MLQKIFFEISGRVNPVNDVVKDYLPDVYALQYLIDMEEQAKSFWLAIFLR